ncbi:Ent3 protein [Saccharomycopsis crataegensis]|uniref:Ent3 protein n=1 Tax=Saccharomycopsis crataegensis TaxID=43959 RepID=A0AAV5QI43_9ASCO|nr:Ent3 protein [Saccharomycopsis crataegensis]
MDLIKEGMKNVSLYEVKKQVRKAQNVVLNYSDMEAKVREATNNEPWGTPSRKMQEIADGTYNYRDREEIVGMIFRRFTEKAANEWRQIYKALILLEYIVKHGSERFVDDARSNMSLISMLKSFQYIDSQGRDQGVNIRNRAKLLIALLNDDNKIRSERKKARENAKKFGGVAGGAPSAASQYGSDFSSTPSFGGAADMVYGDGGVYGARYEEQRPTGGSRSDFEEYDTGSTAAPPITRKTARRSQRRANGTSASAAPAAPQPQVAQDLFSFDDDDEPAATAPTIITQTTTIAASNVDDDDDDFDDFQSAAPSTSATPAPAPSSQFDLLAGLSMNTPTQSQPASSSSILASSYNFSQTTTATTNNITPSYNQPSAAINSVAAKPDAFSSLFSSAKSNNASFKPRQATATTNNNNNNDDLFGDLTSSVPATSSSQPTNSNSNSNDLDLLSF